MDKIRLAVLGLNQGSKIARDAKGNPEIDLVAVAGFGDHDVQVANELDVPIYNDYTLLLKQVDLDAVAIALPNTLHVESVELALESGIKIFSWKTYCKYSRRGGTHYRNLQKGKRDPSCWASP